MSRDPSVEAMLDDHSGEVVATVQRLRDVLLGAHPQLAERARRGWHSINYHDPVAGFVCAVFPGADAVQLVLEHGARLPDPDGRLSGTGAQVRTLEFPAGTEVDADVVVHFLDLAVDLGAALRRR
jgi:hypothetical protein